MGSSIGFVAGVLNIAIKTYLGENINVIVGY